MSNLAIKRINADIKNIKRSKLDKENIFVWANEENIFNMRVLIIGPEIKNSPYQNGFYFFNMDIPTDYPMSPPVVKFITTNGYVRFNPNLYCNGKVCLSILNTWNGPGWSSASTLTMVLLSLQSILHDNPIQNEPGYENECGSKSKSYNNVLAYFNIKIATLGMLKLQPDGFDVFLDVMKDYFIKNIDKYNKFVEPYLKYNNEYLRSGIYNMTITKYDIINLQKKMMLLYSKYLKK